ncbi:hypothetical protein ACWEVD_01865 [Nocardia thailandica]
MATVTAHYGITGSVPFLDVEIGVDNRRFLDPHAIRLHRAPEPFATRANVCTDSFFAEITRSVISTNPFDHRRGQALLRRFSEPWETRLGLATNSFSGHGGAEDVGDWIWTAMSTDLAALVQVGILRQIEDLPLFVEGIDRDLTSDITTRIVYGPLAEFTAAMVEQFPQFRSTGNTVKTFTRQVWDPQNLEWTDVMLELPVAEGKPLLLVPRDWTRSRLLMSSTRYYETSVLGWAQVEQAVVTSTGKVLTTPKDILKSQPGLGRGRSTNLRVTNRAFTVEQDLVSQFRAFVRDQWMTANRAA